MKIMYRGSKDAQSPLFRGTKPRQSVDDITKDSNALVTPSYSVEALFMICFDYSTL